MRRTIAFGLFLFQVAVVITDGRQTTEGGYTRLSVASQGLKSKGVTVFVVGVGKNVDQGELRDMASGPSNVFTAASFTHLQELSPRITTTLCESMRTFTGHCSIVKGLSSNDAGLIHCRSSDVNLS